jgi:exodeoxyribonuclease VII large subunit
LIVDTLEPKGAGALMAAFEKRKQDLAAKGYFDPERKMPLPELPACIGIVTSATGAALYDVLRIAFARHPGLHVILAPSMVQGQGAPETISRAIGWLEKDGRSELILLVRGGGSLEDLWAFNELPVAEAIYHCPIPIVSGVGHEIDFSIADFTADLRAPTPTAAAEMAVPKIADLLAGVDALRTRLARAYFNEIDSVKERMAHLEHRLKVRGVPTTIAAQQLDELSGRLIRAAKETPGKAAKDLDGMKGRLSRGASAGISRARMHVKSRQDRLVSNINANIKQEAQTLAAYKSRLMANSPQRIQKQRQQQLGQLQARLHRAMTFALDENREKLIKQESMLGALSPMNVLGRGYSLTRKADRKTLVRDADQVEPGESLEVLLGNGAIDVRVRKQS